MGLKQVRRSNRVRELRNAKKLTQAGLAQAVGVTRQTIISLEDNRFNPSLDLAFKISRILGSTVDGLFNYEFEGGKKKAVARPKAKPPKSRGAGEPTEKILPLLGLMAARRDAGTMKRVSHLVARVSLKSPDKALETVAGWRKKNPELASKCLRAIRKAHGNSREVREKIRKRFG
ncbi:hypothetical protein COX86_03970 [Candidatus Micrarchaeota archaeon CG_4_10_14_0_2_um_filter_60_11]|nr:MAG: hypothetical protein COU39_02880 [Candidatus Micrarchaeota archaeon CG10_big_fil_rev_8_21_14_0_10_60_32]PIO01628.1 MAG: hypothetical protein COT58_04500 [Candidatus Micrarchaeota archaeon CG09_land_8_20_14_0_10_60_16]PIZ90637.1 MAG: hypothetical protein COX86_03970 [Candidatus Micrarchaeota archaeon CG_4_10_14_0_2_um_filter_60_11]